MTISAFRDELEQVRTKKKEFLSQIERIVPWGEWLAMIQPCYYKGERGNKPYPLEIMLRLYLLQNLYRRLDAGQRYIEKLLERAAAVNTCRFIQLLGNALQRGQEHDQIPPDALPDAEHHRNRQSAPAAVEPADVGRRQVQRVREHVTDFAGSSVSKRPGSSVRIVG